MPQDGLAKLVWWIMGIVGGAALLLLGGFMTSRASVDSLVGLETRVSAIETTRISAGEFQSWREAANGRMATIEGTISDVRAELILLRQDFRTDLGKISDKLDAVLQK